MGKLLKLAILGLTAAAVLGGRAVSAQEAKEEVAATVNGEKIPAGEVQKLLHRDTPTVHPLTAQQKRELAQMALDMLVNDALMRQFLAKNTQPVSAQAINEELAELHKALEKQKTTFAQFLKETMQTEDQLKQEIVSRLQWRSYLQARLPDPLLKQYYDDNKVFFDKVFVKASHILFKVPEKATDAQKAEVKARLAALKQQIDAKQVTFADAAKKQSECPSGAEKGGDIDYFPAKFAVADNFSKAAFSLKVGEVSEPVETGFGYHLIMVTDRTKGEPSSFEEIKEIVRDVYAQEVQLYQGIIAEQRKSAEIKVLVEY